MTISNKQIDLLISTSEQKNKPELHLKLMLTGNFSSIQQDAFNVLYEQFNTKNRVSYREFTLNKKISADPLKYEHAFKDKNIVSMQEMTETIAAQLLKAQEEDDVARGSILYLTLKHDYNNHLPTYLLKEFIDKMDKLISEIEIPDWVGANNDKTETSHLSNILV